MQDFTPTGIAPTRCSILSHEATAWLAPIKREANTIRSSGGMQNTDNLIQAIRDIERALLVGPMGMDA